MIHPKDLCQLLVSKLRRKAPDQPSTPAFMRRTTPRVDPPLVPRKAEGPILADPTTKVDTSWYSDLDAPKTNQTESKS